MPYDLNFGHRTYQEIMAFTANAREAPWFDGFGSDVDLAFDMGCLCKVLPKFSGSRQRTFQPLVQVLAWAMAPDSPEPAAITQELQAGGWAPVNPRLSRTATKALRMLRQVERAGFASFA